MVSCSKGPGSNASDPLLQSEQVWHAKRENDTKTQILQHKEDFAIRSVFYSTIKRIMIDKQYFLII